MEVEVVFETAGEMTSFFSKSCRKKKDDSSFFLVHI